MTRTINSGPELNTVLVALRFWQKHVREDDPRIHGVFLQDIVTNGWTEDALDAEAIDELCERLNTGGDETAHAKEPPKVTYVCATCGSEDVKGDVYAAWNVEKQTWEVASDVCESGGHCNDCKSSCRIRSRPVEHEYSFDIKLNAAIRVKAASVDDARSLLADQLQAVNSNFGAWPNGDPIDGEASLEGTPDLYEIDGESVV